MTKLLEMAVEAAKQLSPEEQDELARTILEIVSGADDEVYVLSDEENSAIDRRLEFADRGEFATDEEVAAVFAKYRL
jgi:predicted transcriptional regulator